MTAESELEGTTVIVTGAAGGIGRALAEGFMGDGATVIGVDLRAADMDSLAAAGCFVEGGDVSDPTVMEQVVKRALAETGRVDVLINNAGVGVERTVEEHGDDEFERILRINLFGPYYGLRSALPAMRAQGYGRVINVVSRHAEFNPAGFAAYGSSKAGLWALTRSVAREVQDDDILVNALIPGPTISGMNPNGTQEPAVVYPTARMLATLPSGGPSGKCFWDCAEYRMYQPDKRLPA